MPIKPKKSASTDLSALLEGLIKADVQFILVGGLAAVIQGAPVMTLDVDILFRQTPENTSKLFSYTQSIDAIYRRPDDIIIQPKKDDFSQKGHLLMTSNLGPIDALAFVEGGKTYEDLFDQSIEIEFRGSKVRVLDMQTLIDLKKRSNAPKDKQRLAVLEETIQQITRHH